MPPQLDRMAGIGAAAPSTGLPTGSGSGRTGRYPALRTPVAAVQAAVEQIRASLASPERTLEFQSDATTGLVTVVIKDARSGEPIRSVPGNTLLRFAEALTASDAGPQALVDVTA